MESAADDAWASTFPTESSKHGGCDAGDIGCDADEGWVNASSLTSRRTGIHGPMCVCDICEAVAEGSLDDSCAADRIVTLRSGEHIGNTVRLSLLPREAMMEGRYGQGEVLIAPTRSAPLGASDPAPCDPVASATRSLRSTTATQSLRSTTATHSLRSTTATRSMLSTTATPTLRPRGPKRGEESAAEASTRRGHGRNQLELPGLPRLRHAASQEGGCEPPA